MRPIRLKPFAAIVLGLCAALGTGQVARPAAQEAPSVETLLARANEYVTQFVAVFSNVVAEEQYEQSWRSFTRRLTSDFHLIQPKDAGGYVALRDVLLVDGTPVRDRDARLMKLLTTPAGGTLEQIITVSKESGRHSFGGVFNNPVVVIAFLQSAFQDRFKFTLGENDRAVGPNVWIVRFAEQTRPTLLKDDKNRDTPSSGQVSIDADTGRVLKTELTLPNDSIVTTFRFDDQFQIAVPIEMVDHYRYQNYTVNGVAMYGRFLRYQVTTNDNVDVERKGQ